MKLNIPERGINLANHPQGQKLAEQVALWVMAQGIMPANREYQLCERLSTFALGMSETCWIRRLDYRTLMELDQPDHYVGRNINSNTRRESVIEFASWFRREYIRQNPEFLFEILDI
jgi:hypothetical protein